MTDFTIEGLAVAWRGPVRDRHGWHGCRFDRDATQFCLKWFDTRPLLLRHDEGQLVTTDVVGRVTELQHTDAGLWARCTVDGKGEHAAWIRQGVEHGRLFFSTGTSDACDAGGLYLRWPIVELSLAPGPNNPFCITWPEVRDVLDRIGRSVDLSDVPTERVDRVAKEIVAEELAKRAAFDRRMADLHKTLTFDGQHGYTVLLRRDPGVTDAMLADRLSMTVDQFMAARELGNVAIVTYALSDALQASVEVLPEGVEHGTTAHGLAVV